MFVSVEQAACAGHCYTESAAVLDSESQRALETVQRAADNIIKQKDQIIEWWLHLVSVCMCVWYQWHWEYTYHKTKSAHFLINAPGIDQSTDLETPALNRDPAFIIPVSHAPALETGTINRLHFSAACFLVRVSCKSGSGFVWYQKPAPIRTLFYSNPESCVQATEMIIYDLFLLRIVAVVLVVQRFGVGLVIERSLVRLSAGVLSSH